MNALGLTAFLGIALATASCFGFGEPSRDEVARISSPSGQLDAVVIETNGGATTSFGYEVHIVPEGTVASKATEVASLYGAVRNEQAYGVNVRWRRSDLLAVEYLRAKDASLRRPRVSVNGRDVQVVLAGSIADPEAPSGGMLYNLERGAKR
jgi:hypothetical protein